MAIDSIQLGGAIGQIRRQRDLTQQEVADAIGVTKNYVSLLETGKRGATIETLSDLSELLKVPLPCLIALGYKPTPRKRNPLSKLVKTMQKTVLAVVGLEEDLDRSA